MEKSVRTKAAPARRGKRPTAERMATAAQGGNIKKKLSLTRSKILFRKTIFLHNVIIQNQSVYQEI